MAKIEAIIAKSFVPGTSAKLEIKGEFLPLARTTTASALFEHYAARARGLGFEPSADFTGGCADSGFTAATGAPTLCAVGPVGGKAHARRNTSSSTASCRARRRWRWRSCGSSERVQACSDAAGQRRRMAQPRAATNGRASGDGGDGWCRTRPSVRR